MLVIAGHPVPMRRVVGLVRPGPVFYAVGVCCVGCRASRLLRGDAVPTAALGGPAFAEGLLLLLDANDDPA